MNTSVMLAGLAEVLDALGPSAERVLLVGGYGLYLKQQHLRRTGEPTLIEGEHWPVPRATNDFDLLLEQELLADLADMRFVRETFSKLGYTVIKGAEHYHFERDTGTRNALRIDLLTSQPDRLEPDGRIRRTDHRAGPQARRGQRPLIHAWPTTGILHTSERGTPLVVPISFTTRTTEPTTSVRIPHTFDLMLMKLAAYREQKKRERPGYGKNAVDLYRAIAMTTRGENAEMRRLLEPVMEEPIVVACRDTVHFEFSEADGPGIRHILDDGDWLGATQPNTDSFIGALCEFLAL